MTDVDVTVTDDASTPIVEEVVPDVLSPRQREVYDMHKSGDTNVTIAKALDIAPGTVSNALVAARTKMGEVNAPTMGDMTLTQLMEGRRERINARTQEIKDELTHLGEELTQIEGMLSMLVEDDAEVGDEG